MNKPSNHQPEDQRTCILCGLPLRHGKVTSVISERSYSFCCNGCRQVFTILMESTDSQNPEAFHETELFKQCRAMGIIPSSVEELARTDSAQAEAAPVSSAAENDHVLTLKLMVSNMWCPACAWIIDESLKKSPGIFDSACNFST
ncbi:MAG: heavy metal translocating P-type ATPase metal-binding domain-containing protein, partial [Desulfobacterales bacterium]